MRQAPEGRKKPNSGAGRPRLQSGRKRRPFGPALAAEGLLFSGDSIRMQELNESAGERLNSALKALSSRPEPERRDGGVEGPCVEL